MFRTIFCCNTHGTTHVQLVGRQKNNNVKEKSNITLQSQHGICISGYRRRDAGGLRHQQRPDQHIERLYQGRISSEDAAKRRASHPEASSTPLKLQQRLGGLWMLLNETAVNAKAVQPKIISLLQAIRQLPHAKVPKDEGESSVDFDDVYCWRELTDWANDWADSFNGYGSCYLIEHTTGDQAQGQRKTAWSNACAYTARLAATGDEALSSHGAG
jgi:hypothetical protein